MGLGSQIDVTAGSTESAVPPFVARLSRLTAFALKGHPAPSHNAVGYIDVVAFVKKETLE